MELPMKIEKFVAQVECTQSFNWVEMLDVINGKPCTRLFAYKRTKTYGLECKEVGREYIDHNETSGSLYYGQMCGYQVLFERKNNKQLNGYGATMDVDDELYPTTGFFYPHVCKSVLYTAKDVYELFKDYVPYFSCPTLENIYSVMEFVRAYKDNPKVESLSKFGLPYLYKDKRLFRLTKKKQSDLVRWLNQNRDYALQHLPTLDFILMGVRNNEDAEETKIRCMTMNDLKFAHHRDWFKDYKYEQFVEISKYLNYQQVDIGTYLDYLEASRIIGRNISDRGVMFPRNLIEQHDRVTAMVDRRKNKSLNKKLKKVYGLLQQYGLSYKGLQIVIPQNQSDLVKWGNALHNCVGTMGYGEKMALGKCIILGVFKDGKPIECCELRCKEKSTKMYIEQLRGEHNQPSDMHPIAEKLINKFIHAYSSRNLVGACV